MASIRTAIVLSGGASYGAYEVGVLKALAEGTAQTGYQPLAPHVIAGTSAGAFNAAIMTAYSISGMETAATHLETEWMTRIAEGIDGCDGTVIRYRGNPFALINPACATGDRSGPFNQFVSDSRFIVKDSFRRGLRALAGGGELGQRLLDLVNLETIISGTPYQSLVVNDVPLAAIRSAPVDIRIAATNWKTGEVMVFGNDDMTEDRGHQIILASSAIPGIFTTVKIDGVPYADGGLVMNTPLRPAIDAGCDVIHAVSINPQVQDLSLQQLPSTIGEIYRSLSISLASSLNRDIEIAARINQGIGVLETAGGGMKDATAMRNLTLFLGSLAKSDIAKPYRRLEIHRYQLSNHGDSFLKWLDFRQKRLASLIRAGYRDTKQHDCRISGCVLPN